MCTAPNNIVRRFVSLKNTENDGFIRFYRVFLVAQWLYIYLSFALAELHVWDSLWNDSGRAVSSENA